MVGGSVLDNNKMIHLIQYILSRRCVAAVLSLPVTSALYGAVPRVYKVSTRNLYKGGQGAT